MRRVSTFARVLLAASLAVSQAAVSEAQVVNLGPGSFTPAATAITFSEPGYPLNTINPVYTFNGLPGLGNVTVSFAGAFMGQTVTGTTVRTLTGDPTGPLALNTAVQAFTTNDGSNPTSPILSGTPTFNGPIAMLFSTPVAAVGLSGGFFNALNATTIRAYDGTGAVLGSITNSVTGIEFYGLATANGANSIAGIAFFITGNEPAGFAIDNVTFGSVNVLVNPPGVVPEPESFALLAVGLAGLALVRVKRRRA